MQWHTLGFISVAALATSGLIACGALGTRSGEEATARTSSALSQPDASIPATQTLPPSRPVVSVGRDWVFVTDSGTIRAYQRRADANGTIAISTKSNPDYANSFQNMFSTITSAYNAEVHQINTQYAGQVPTPIQECTPDGGACADSWYDGDTVYDEYSGHFFVMTKERRPVWDCLNEGVPVPYPLGPAPWRRGRSAVIPRA